MRGGLFNSNVSTSWSTQGLTNGENGAIYSLTAVEEELLLNLTGQGGFYGYDDVRLGLEGQSVPVLKHQLIAAIGTNEFFIGSLGLSPWPTNLTDLNSRRPSVLGSLRNRSLIPSTSWGYTQGAYFSTPPVFASLTLGGYDQSRFEKNNLSLPFGSDISRDLLVRLQSITYDTAGSSPLLTTSAGVDVFIDSMTAELWLPESVCQAFAQQFRLTWNAQSGRYFVNESSHKALVDQNPTFMFTIGRAGGGGQTVGIKIPYGALDHNLTAPITGVNSTQRYFPLRRALDPSQYTLGRAFLQAAYVIADYDRGNFSVSQALYPASSVPQNIVSIQAPSNGRPTGDDGKQPLAGWKIALIVIGCSIVIGLGLWLWVRRRKRAQPKVIADYSKVDTDESREESEIHEVGGETTRWEADGRNTGAELPVNANGVYEMEQPVYVHEMWTRNDR